MDATVRQARIAGVLYLLVAVTAPLGLLVVPAQIFVDGDPAATAARVAASTGLLRLGIASELLHQAIQVFLLLALYQLFRPVSDALAKQLVVLGALVSVPIAFVNVLNELAALMLADAAIPWSLGSAQRADLVYLFVSLHAHGITVVSVFWGLWLFPFGLLVIRCGFIPVALGYLLLIAGVGYLAGSFLTILLPEQAALIDQVTTILVLGEIPIVFWLLIWGARRPAPA
jgi:hypothetical protein